MANQEAKRPPLGWSLHTYTNLLSLVHLGKFLVELVDAAVSCNEALLAGVERVAVAAGINLDVSSGRTSLEGAAAGGAGDSREVISWMDIFLHFALLLSPYGIYLIQRA